MVGFLLPLFTALAASSAAPPGAHGWDHAGQGAGPAAVTLPPDAVVARTEGELSRLLSDPAGPARIGLLPRTYRGGFTVKRKVELVGQRGAVLDGGGLGTVLTIDAEGAVVRDVALQHSGHRETAEDAGIRARGSGVTLSHVSVEDTLFGISLEQCARCTVDGARVRGSSDETARGDAIKLWESDDAVVRGCLVEDSRDIVVWYSRRAHLEGNFVTRSRYGTHFMYAHDSVVRGSNIVGNIVGVFVMYSNRIRVEDSVLAGAGGPAGMGIGFKESDSADLSGNFIVGNTVGAYFDATPRSPAAPVRFSGNVVALNDVGLRFLGAEHGIELSGNDFRDNTEVVDGDGAEAEYRGNYFSDYAGYDLDRDGVGDVPHRELVLSSALLESRPSLRFFQGTLAMGLLDALSRVIPVFAMRTMLTDDAPRMHPWRAIER